MKYKDRERIVARLNYVTTDLRLNGKNYIIIEENIFDNSMDELLKGKLKEVMNDGNEKRIKEVK